MPTLDFPPADEANRAMDLFETIATRRSYRKFDKTRTFPEDAVRKALEAAVKAPNSSNTQTWDFYWVKSEEKKSQLIRACLSQSAARQADHLIVAVATPARWRRSQAGLVAWAKTAKTHPSVLMYYEKLVPLMYSSGPLNLLAPFKFLASLITGFFRPIMRGPLTRRDIEEVAIKSAALACENFVLAITAQGGATCMMEGIDEWRVKSLLGLGWCRSRVVMVIAVGYPTPEGLWGSQFRLPTQDVIHEV